jgi:hypothetical protein
MNREGDCKYLQNLNPSPHFIFNSRIMTKSYVLIDYPSLTVQFCSLQKIWQRYTNDLRGASISRIYQEARRNMGNTHRAKAIIARIKSFSISASCSVRREFLRVPSSRLRLCTYPELPESDHIFSEVILFHQIS